MISHSSSFSSSFSSSSFSFSSSSFSSSSSSSSSIDEPQATNPTLKTEAKTKFSHAILSKIKSIFRNEKHIHSKNTSTQINQTEKPSASLLPTLKTKNKNSKYTTNKEDLEKRIKTYPCPRPLMAKNLNKTGKDFQGPANSEIEKWTSAKESTGEQVSQTKNHQLPLYSFKPTQPSESKLADFRRSIEMIKAKRGITKSSVGEQVSQTKNHQLPPSPVKPALFPKPNCAIRKIQPNFEIAKINIEPVFYPKQHRTVETFN
ncbi:hypothetical protein [Pectobacterium parvum]|uniref:hypothetical protein n=1 Tax=Pectobacterium parvum TaxID=2778550 RepID=UPI0011BF4F9D|nr:hypothetical protein [Pectobacterium parvum]